MKDKKIREFGDFQTPVELADKVCQLLANKIQAPGSVLEPTCGLGNFLVAAMNQFPTINEFVGVEINPEYAEVARTHLQNNRGKIIQQSFFDVDWPSLFGKLSEPILIVGNPPWVTNSELGAIHSHNLPVKINFQKYAGIEALTGKSNFDISEWMLIHILEWINRREATMAVLCKTTVARRLFDYIYKNNIAASSIQMYYIDAMQYFNASVDACLFICSSCSGVRKEPTCEIYQDLDCVIPSHIIGIKNGHLLANLDLYHRWKHLEGNPIYTWRSGIKHDCSRVMECTKEGEFFKNGFEQIIELEKDYMYLMLKSSDIANATGSIQDTKRWMMVTQSRIGEPTSLIQCKAPLTWSYLLNNATYLDNRASSIYKKQPRFSIFGVGDYAFSPWKIAISGFYKKIEFVKVGSVENKPMVLDDTCYFIPCYSEEEADCLLFLLNSKPAKEFFEAFIFWDAKRPIKSDILQKLDLLNLAQELNVQSELRKYVPDLSEGLQQTLFAM